MLAHLPAGLAKDAAAKIRAIAKIESWLLSETRLVQTGPDGFVLGFAGHDITELTLAANRLGQAVKSHLGPSPGASIRPPMRQSALRSARAQLEDDEPQLHTLEFVPASLARAACILASWRKCLPR